MTIEIKANNMKDTFAVYEVPALVGSEKQIVWAEKIRRAIAYHIAAIRDEEKDETTMKIVQWMFEYVTDVKLYIDNRLDGTCGSYKKTDVQKAIQKFVGLEKIEKIIST